MEKLGPKFLACVGEDELENFRSAALIVCVGEYKVRNGLQFANLILVRNVGDDDDGNYCCGGSRVTAGASVANCIASRLNIYRTKHVHREGLIRIMDTLCLEHDGTPCPVLYKRTPPYPMCGPRRYAMPRYSCR